MKAIEHIKKLRPFVYSIELRDPYTKGHSERVGVYAKNFAKYISLDEKKCEDLYMAGLLHDLGKVAVPDMVLLKPGKLEKDEFEIIKYHPVLSAKIVEEIDEYAYLATIIKHHHERFDGKGYPDALKEEEIPFLSRILSICDVFDALTTDRIYRKAFSLETAINIMTKMEGAFDDKLFNQFKEFIQQYGIIKENLYDISEVVLDKLRDNLFFIDPLTKFLNRDALLTLLQKFTDENLHISLIEINIKKFKNYNKVYGIQKGDELLQRLAKEIKSFFKTITTMEKITNKDVYGIRVSADIFVLLSIGRRSEFLEYKLESFQEIVYQKLQIEIESKFIIVDKKLTKNLINEIGYLL